jgi:hypothetical protein
MIIISSAVAAISPSAQISKGILLRIAAVCIPNLQNKV